MTKHRTTFVCQQCGGSYARAKGRAGKFCSYACANIGNRHPKSPLEERFWKRVIKTTSGCWKWAGAKDKDGYGMMGKQIYFAPGEQRANRISWILNRGEIPHGFFILHKCDNPECTNPDHLFLGNAAENNRDMIEKGRQRYLSGEDSPNSKLTEKQVLEIRRRAVEEGRGIQRRLAEEFGVGFKCISKIVKRMRWAHV